MNNWSELTNKANGERETLKLRQAIVETLPCLSCTFGCSVESDRSTRTGDEDDSS